MTIERASDNPFPSVLMVEGDPEDLAANPDAGQRRLAVGLDHLLYLVDDAGVKTQVGSSASVATDTIFDAKGDLPVGTGANTSAKLTVGANDTIPMADSGQATGIKWVGSQTPSTQAFSDAAAEGTADTYARGDHKHAMPASPGGGGALVFLEAHSASASATLDFTTFISSTYDTYIFKFISILPATSTAILNMRMGTGGGPTYASTNEYGTQNFRHSFNGSALSGADSGAAQIALTTAWLSTGAHAINGTLELYDPQNATFHKFVNGKFIYPDSGISNMVAVEHAGQFNSPTAVTAVRFLMSSGNITSGTIRVYGVAKS